MKPSFPKNLYFAGGGLGAGFALGLAILYVLMAMDQTLHTEREIELHLKLPVLASVPVLQIAGVSAETTGVINRPVSAKN